MKKPLAAEATVLARCFPSTSSQSVSKKRPLQSPEPAFDPTAACVAQRAKRMKKAFGGSKARVKPSNVTVVMLPKFCYSVPRGKKRKALQEQGRIQVVQVNRSMTPEEVQAAIRSGFQHLELPVKFTYLQCSPQGALSVSLSQEVDGESAASRKGSLYFSEGECCRGKVILCVWLIMQGCGNYCFC